MFVVDQSVWVWPPEQLLLMCELQCLGFARREVLCQGSDACVICRCLLQMAKAFRMDVFRDLLFFCEEHNEGLDAVRHEMCVSHVRNTHFHKWPFDGCVRQL